MKCECYLLLCYWCHGSFWSLLWCWLTCSSRCLSVEFHGDAHMFCVVLQQLWYIDQSLWRRFVLSNVLHYLWMRGLAATSPMRWEACLLWISPVWVTSPGFRWFTLALSGKSCIAMCSFEMFFPNVFYHIKEHCLDLNAHIHVLSDPQNLMSFAWAFTTICCYWE